MIKAMLINRNNNNQTLLSLGFFSSLALGFLSIAFDVLQEFFNILNLSGLKDHIGNFRFYHCSLVLVPIIGRFILY